MQTQLLLRARAAYLWLIQTPDSFVRRESSIFPLSLSVTKNSVSKTFLGFSLALRSAFHYFYLYISDPCYRVGDNFRTLSRQQTFTKAFEKMMPMSLLSFAVLCFASMVIQADGCLFSSGCSKRDCIVSSWSKWSNCTQPCGEGGTQWRTRRVTKGARCGGSCSYLLADIRSCNDVCPNGGTPVFGKCHCKPGYSGKCCTGGNYSCAYR